MKHFTRNTVSASHWCGKCLKHTQHEVHGVKLGACMECIAKLEVKHAEKKPDPPAKQENLF